MKGNYFSNLNYTLGNEDSSLEFQLLPKNTNHVFAIAGAGGRILPLFAKYPKNVTCIDVSESQLYLTELRIESMRVFKYSNYLSFWGYPPLKISSEDRKRMFQQIHLSKNAKAFNTMLFERYNWESVLYIGSWEKTFAKLSKLINFSMGKYSDLFFKFTKEEDYQKFIKKDFPRERLSIITTLLGNVSIFNALLYKGKFPKKNTPGSMKKFYFDSFNKLLHQGLPRNNFFLQIIFFGKLLYKEGNPIECQPVFYGQVQQGIRNAKIEYILGDCIKEMEKNNFAADFVSFSDISSYFEPRREKNYLQRISKSLLSNCILVERRYLHIPENVDLSGYKNITDNYKNGIQQEKTQMYDIRVLQKES